MTVKAHTKNAPTVQDYENGSHYGWEVDAHEAEYEFMQSTGRPWSFTERRTWLSKYYVVTPYSVAYGIRPCSLCVKTLAIAKLEGRDPWAMPPSVVEEVTRLTRKIGNVLGLKKRHIDSV